VVVLDYPGLETVEYVIATRPVTFPYIPGLLSFREGPVILDRNNLDEFARPVCAVWLFCLLHL